MKDKWEYRLHVHINDFTTFVGEDGQSGCDISELCRLNDLEDTALHYSSCFLQ
jgi:hypothetical protein